VDVDHIIVVLLFYCLITIISIPLS